MINACTVLKSACKDCEISNRAWPSSKNFELNFASGIVRRIGFGMLDGIFSRWKKQFLTMQSPWITSIRLGLCVRLFQTSYFSGPLRGRLRTVVQGWMKVRVDCLSSLWVFDSFCLINKTRLHNDALLFLKDDQIYRRDLTRICKNKGIGFRRWNNKSFVSILDAHAVSLSYTVSICPFDLSAFVIVTCTENNTCHFTHSKWADYCTTQILPPKIERNPNDNLQICAIPHVPK